MTTHKSFVERLKQGEVLVADGATGTNLLARGLPRGVSSEAWVLERPDEIIRLHQDFIEAGAQILLTCTFGASPIRLEETRLAGEALQINRRAVELARQAVENRPILIAGSMGPCGKLLAPFGPLQEDAVIESYGEQAQALDKAGVDLLVIETQFDLSEALAAIIGARNASDLPIVCSFSFDRGVRTMMGVRPRQVGERLSGMEIQALGINCGRSLEENLAALKEMRQSTAHRPDLPIWTDLPIWFKPNAGMPAVDELGNTRYNLSPEDMGRQVRQWIEAGAQIVGGCCGASPEHLRQIALAVQSIA